MSDTSWPDVAMELARAVGPGVGALLAAWAAGRVVLGGNKRARAMSNVAVQEKTRPLEQRISALERARGWKPRAAYEEGKNNDEPTRP